MATVLLLFTLVCLVLLTQLVLQGRAAYGREIPAVPAGGDLAVIGGTTAALLAAREAAENGAQVFLFPDQQPPGEDSAWLIETGLAAALTPPQLEQGIEFTPEMLQAYLELYGGGINDPLLLHSFCDAAPELFHWATEAGAGGISFSLLPQPEQHPYLHYSPSPAAGLHWVEDLLAAVEQAGVTLRKEKVQEIKLTPDGKVEALVLQEPSGEKSIFYVQAVVLADGGYSGDLSSRPGCRFPENLLVLRPNQRGKWLRWAEKEGLDLVQMNFLEMKLALTSSSAEAFAYWPAELWPETVFFNSKGQILWGKEASFSQIVNFVQQAPAGSVKIVTVTVPAAVDRSYFMEIAGMEDLEKFGLPGDLFRSAGWRLPLPPYYLATLQAGVTYTLGGVAVTPRGEVKKAGEALKGLYAAGEIIGGLHGETLLPGMPLSETLFTARVAGRCAAEYAGR